MIDEVPEDAIPTTIPGVYYRPIPVPEDSDKFEPRVFEMCSPGLYDRHLAAALSGWEWNLVLVEIGRASFRLRNNPQRQHAFEVILAKLAEGLIRSLEVQAQDSPIRVRPENRQQRRQQARKKRR